MSYIIRKRQQKDCNDIANVVTVAWNETYKGIVSDEFLANLHKNKEQRAINSLRKFNEKDNHQFVLEVDNKIVGFIKVRSASEKSYTDCGEIQSLYIINGYKGYGYGRKLLEAGITELKRMGYNKMIISCLQGNPSNNFYKYIGGKFIKTRIFQLLKLPENVYYFDKI